MFTSKLIFQITYILRLSIVSIHFCVFSFSEKLGIRKYCGKWTFCRDLYGVPYRYTVSCQEIEYP